VFASADEGEPVGRIATTLRVSVAYVSKALTRRRMTGQTTARPQCCRVLPKLAELYPAIEAQVSRHRCDDRRTAHVVAGDPQGGGQHGVDPQDIGRA